MIVMISLYLTVSRRRGLFQLFYWFSFLCLWLVISGRHQAVEQFCHALDQESISDKIYSSLYASYEGKTGIEIPDADKLESDKTESDGVDEAAVEAESSCQQ